MIAESRDIVERQVHHLTHLVDDLLDASRITRGVIALQKEEVAAGTAMAHAVETARPLIESRGHALSVSLPPEPVQVEADPVRREQVLANLRCGGRSVWRCWRGSRRRSSA